MGSLTSRPKVPAMPQTVYVPTYYYPSAPAPQSSASQALPTSQVQSESQPATPTPEEQNTAQRSASLLERRRGVLSTVLTGFRGILDQTTAPQRKTLLGE